MTLRDKRVVLTGAGGGIGTALAYELARAGARLLLVGRDPERLELLAQALSPEDPPAILALDLTADQAPAQLLSAARQALGGVDVLINAAGYGRLALVEQDDPAGWDRLMELNLLVPMRLARAVLPLMQAQGGGQIVNIGSTFGRLAFPGHAAYSASKFGLRGWSEALRRELAGSGIRVSHLSPRATRTRFNDARGDALNDALGNAVDSPAAVAAQLCRAIDRGQAELQIGWPEKLFVRLNALFPALVDQGLRGKLERIRDHAQTPAQGALHR